MLRLAILAAAAAAAARDDPLRYDHATRTVWFAGATRALVESGAACVTVERVKYCSTPSGSAAAAATTGYAPLVPLATRSYEGVDDTGAYTAHEETWAIATAAAPVLITTTLVYTARNAVLYRQDFPRALAGTSVGGGDPLSTVFPRFRMGEAADFPAAYLWSGLMAGAGGEGSSTAKAAFEKAVDSKPVLERGPMVLYDAGSAVVISAASNFMAHSQGIMGGEYPQARAGGVAGGDADTHYYGYGVMGGVASIPAGYRLETIVVGAAGEPVNAVEDWGAILRERYHNDRGSGDDDADFTVVYLGYSTDNGAWYYYKTEDDKDYQTTMVDVFADAAQRGIPYRHWLMDSWWYPKDAGGAVTEWVAMPSVFPDGIEYVYNETLLPIVAHNRYWSTQTGYATANGGKYKFIIEPQGNQGKGLALPDDPAFWDDLMRTSKAWGLRVYEQDWLNVQFLQMNATLSSATLARRWLLEMGGAAKRHDLHIQYCMSLPRHVLQSLEIPAVTQARASGDYHPGNDQWQNLGWTAVFLHALRIRPTKDNFWTSDAVKGRYGNDVERYNRLHSAVSTFSAGPVAPSDPVGASDVALIMKSCAATGKLLAPDVPARAVRDAFYAVGGMVEGGAAGAGQIWSAHTELATAKYFYVIAAQNAAYALALDSIARADTAAMSREYLAAEANATAAAAVPVSAATPLPLPASDKWSFTVWTLAPVLANGMVFLGERAKWVAVSRSRIRALDVNGDGLQVAIVGMPGEKVTLWYMCARGAPPASTTTTIGDDGTASVFMAAS